jgi:hypothetical protein
LATRETTFPKRATIVEQIEHVLITERNGEASGDRITALCHAHDDHNPSMSWSRSKHVWKCFACSASGGYVDLARQFNIEVPRHQKPAYVEKIRWAIKDVDDQVIAFHIRKERPNDSKDKIIPWDRKLDRPLEDMPLYGAHLVKYFDPTEMVFITEGEKASDALRKLGKQVLGTVTGAEGTPSSDVLSVTAGFDVYLWPDKDEPGRAHMKRIAEALPEAPVFINWTEAPPKGDVADFVELGGTEEALAELIGNADLSLPSLPSENVVPFSHPVGVKEEGTTSEKLEISAGVFDAAGILNYQAPPVQWQWGDRITVGGFALLASKPKIGKSQLLLGLALATCRGNNFLDWATRQGPVLYLAFEGHMRDVTNRLKMMGLRSDDQIHLWVDAPPAFDGQDESIFNDWLEPLINLINPVLVIIDTLFRMLPGVADANDYSLVNRAMSPLEYIARRTDVTILVSHHANKGNDNSDDPGQTILGSTAILGAVDTALVMSRRKGAKGASPGRELMSIQREGESLEPIVISLDDSGWSKNMGQSEIFAVESAKQRIRDVLNEAGGQELAAAELQEKTGIKNKTYGTARQTLVDSGDLLSRTDGKRKFYSLRDSQEFSA